MNFVLSELLKENTSDTVSIQYSADTVLYLIETYFKNDSKCDYMKQTMIMIDMFDQYDIVLLPIIEINGNIITASTERWYIRKNNNKYLRHYPNINEYGSEFYLTEINKMDLYQNSSKRDYVESSYYIEKEGVIINGVNIRYTGICP